MRVGWLRDDASNPGGAELTQAEFRAAAPAGVEIVDCPPGKVRKDCDRYVVQNCVKYPVSDLDRMPGKPVFKYWHDVGPWLHDMPKGYGDRKAWLFENTTPICCSPMQAAHMGLETARLIPPPVDLSRFWAAGDRSNGHRTGAVSVASWRNLGKAPHKVLEWAQGNGGVDFYGGGEVAPPGSRDIPYEDMPALLARYQTFVFLPTVIEPFGRLVAEAWAAGCEVVTNGLVGARYWIENNPAAIETAATDFWETVTE